MELSTPDTYFVVARLASLFIIPLILFVLVAAGQIIQFVLIRKLRRKLDLLESELRKAPRP